MFSRREFLGGLALGGTMLMAGDPDSMARAAGGPEAGAWDPEKGGPHLGSLWQLVQANADRAPRSLSYRNANLPLEEWKRAGRAKVSELLRYAPPRVPLDFEVVSEVRFDGYRRQRVLFNTSPETRVPAFLLVPDKAEFPAPGIIAIHDHGGFYRWGKEKIVENEQEHPALAKFKQTAYEGRSHASELARRGYVVLVIDAFYFGERRLASAPLPAQSANPAESDDAVTAFNRLAGQSEQLTAKTLFWGGMTWPGVLFWDDMRSVDALAALKEVDPKRIGCIGLSIGGYRSAHLAALDERIKCAVVAGWMSAVGPMLRNHLINHTWMIYIPGMLQYMDLPDIMSLHCPQPLRVIAMEKDALFPLDAVKQSLESIAAAYQANGAGERFESRIYADRPHEFNREMQDEAFAFFRKWL